ncbi:gamma-glutamylcyclotransferase family protein [Motiliproteus sediminis]|uniref:gamma-glutamylcyclotransferase family protein n=1 Tax=Motiliproteus sediminis TaxID=1468178 RepID=UPI001AEFE2BC|nr:gamma-glutamylcyclotransferase family protein [Motiliproteus sediminis]
MPYYIAYGSNLHPLRLQHRLGAVIPLARLRLEGFTICFHKRGRDNSAKCDLIEADPTIHAYAALYQLSSEQLQQLDQFEGGYRRAFLRVELARQPPMDAITYRAETHLIDADLRPFDWYLALMRAGGEALGFDTDYQQRLAAIEQQQDADRARAAQQQRLVAALRRQDTAHLQRLPWGRAYATSTIS